MTICGGSSCGLEEVLWRAAAAAEVAEEEASAPAAAAEEEKGAAAEAAAAVSAAALLEAAALSFDAATSAASAAIDRKVNTCGPPTGISRTSSTFEDEEDEEAADSISSWTSLATSRPSTGLILVPPSPVRTTSFLFPVSRGSRSHELMSRKKAVGRRMRTFRVDFGLPSPPPPETAAADAAFAASSFAAATTASTASSFASEIASACLESLPSNVATITKTRRTGGGGRDEAAVAAAAAKEEEGTDDEEEVAEAAAAAALLACSKNASVPSRSTLQTEPSVLSKLRTPRAETAAEAPSQQPAMVAGSVTSPCQISAPSLERRAATAEEVEEEEAKAEVAVDAAALADFFGLTMARTRNLPFLMSSFTTRLPMCPVAPATTTSGRLQFEEEEASFFFFFVGEGIDGIE